MPDSYGSTSIDSGGHQQGNRVNTTIDHVVGKPLQGNKAQNERDCNGLCPLIRLTLNPNTACDGIQPAR
jgi:hypothetical protein